MQRQLYVKSHLIFVFNKYKDISYAESLDISENIVAVNYILNCNMITDISDP